jgi:hypothetical protein
MTPIFETGPCTIRLASRSPTPLITLRHHLHTRIIRFSNKKLLFDTTQRTTTAQCNLMRLKYLFSIPCGDMTEAKHARCVWRMNLMHMTFVFHSHDMRLKHDILIRRRRIPPATCGHAKRRLIMDNQQQPRTPIQTRPLTRIFFALHIRHAKFLTLPSACTTSGANSMPNLITSVSPHTYINVDRVTHI